MSSSSDSPSKAILGEPQGNREYDPDQHDQGPEIGQAVLDDLDESQLAAFCSLKHNLGRKLLFLRLGIGSKLPLSIRQTAELLGMSKADTEELESHTLLELKKILSPSDLAWVKDLLSKSRLKKSPAEIERQKNSSKYDALIGDDSEDEEEYKRSTAAPNRPLKKPVCPKTKALSDHLKQAIKKIHPSLASVLRQRLGIGMSHPMTVDEVSKATGHTPVTISLLCMRAKKALSAHLTPDKTQVLEDVLPGSLATKSASTPEIQAKVKTLAEIRTEVAKMDKPTATKQEAVRTIALKGKGARTHLLPVQGLIDGKVTPLDSCSVPPDPHADPLDDPAHPVALAIHSLSPRESKVMRVLLGVGTNKPLTILSAKDTLSMTCEEIEELAASAMGKLKAELSPEDNRLIKKKFSPKDCLAIKNRIRREAQMTDSMTDNTQPAATPETPGKVMSLEEIQAAITPVPTPPVVQDEVVAAVEPVAQEQTAEAPVDRVQQAIDALGSRRGQVMRLRLGIGLERALTTEETAERLGSTYAGIASTVYVALKELKTRLTPPEVREIQKKLAQAKSPRKSKAAASPAPAPQPELPAVPELVAVVEETTDTRVEEPPPAAAERATPEAAPPPNDELLQELKRSLVELQASVQQLTTKNRDLLTRVEALEHEGEEQNEKIKDFLGELDRREVVRTNAFTKVVENLRAEVAVLKAPTKLPTDPPPPTKPAEAEVIPINEANQHKAGPDGFFQAEGSSWGLTDSLARRLGIDESALKSRLASGKARSRKGLDYHGTVATFYSWIDALRLCSDLITVVPQNSYGQVRINSQTYVTQHQLTKMMRTTPGSLLQRIDPSVRSCLSKCPTGIYLYYRASDVKRVCADILSKPRNSTPRKAQRAK